MKFETLLNLTEARGENIFDYKFWFWAKDEQGRYGIGYARRENIVGIDFKDEDVWSIDIKKEINVKRLKNILSFFSSPIIMYWIDEKRLGAQKRIGMSKPDASDTEVTMKLDIEPIGIVHTKPGDVTTEDGKDFNVISLFRKFDNIQDMFDLVDWDKLKINDADGDTLNTIYARFAIEMVNETSDKKSRTKARTETLPNVMKKITFQTDKNVTVKPFLSTDYKMLPDSVTSKKYYDPETKINFGNFLRDNAKKLNTTAQKRFQ